MQYPKTKNINIGYAPKEDRLLLLAHLEHVEPRRAMIPRRILKMILENMGGKLTGSHPASERNPDPDVVLQMEHIFAVSGRNKDQGEKVPDKSPAKSYLVTGFQVETQGKNLVLGLKGEMMDSSDKETVAIAGISLGRSQAHQLLRMLWEQAEQAGWDVGQFVNWMSPVTY